MPVQNQKNAIYFPALDALRSIACLFVLFAHILWEKVGDLLKGKIPGPVYTFLDFFFNNGGMGVRIFFCLSGFLITYLILKEINKKGKVDLKNFYIRRILRIWPVYYIVIFFVFVVYVATKSFIGIHSPVWEKPMLSVFFLSNYDLIHILSTPGEYPNGMLSLTWSVSVEEQFYLFWPLLFFLFPKRLYKYLIGFVIAVSILFCLYHAADFSFIYHHTLANFIFLGTGGALAYLMVNKPTFLQGFKLSRISWIMIFSIGLLILIYSKDPLYQIRYGIVGYWIYTAIFLFFVLYTQVSNIARPFDLSKIKWLVLMGKYTYGLYMYHRIGMFAWDIILNKMIKIKSGTAGDLIFIILGFITAFLLSYLSYQFIEKRFLRLKDRFSYFRKTEPQPVPVQNQAGEPNKVL